MTDRQRSPFSALRDFRPSGSKQVLFTADVCDACEELKGERPESWAQLVAAAERFISGALMGSFLRDEDRHKYGGDQGKKVHLFALGGKGFRVYGFVRALDKKETFIGVRGVVKKTNKANPQALAISAKACKIFIEG